MDLGVVLVVAILGIQGLFRGLLAQVLGLAGLVIAIAAGIAIRQWVGAHWQGAQPAVVFWVLRWLVILLCGVAVLSLFQVVGQRVGDVVGDSAIGWMDRLGGLALGATFGIAVASLLVLASVRAHSPRWVRHGVDHSRYARRLVVGGADWSRQVVSLPGGAALHRQYVIGERSFAPPVSTI